MKENVITLTFAINAKKALLKKGDYKVIKCMEAQLTGNELPYNIEELTAERNAIRAEINELEAKLAEYKTK